MNAKIQLFQEKKNGFFIDFFYIRSQRSVVSSQQSEARSQNFFVSLQPKQNNNTINNASQ